MNTEEKHPYPGDSSLAETCTAFANQIEVLEAQVTQLTTDIKFRVRDLEEAQTAYEVIRKDRDDLQVRLATAEAQLVHQQERTYES